MGQFLVLTKRVGETSDLREFRCVRYRDVVPGLPFSWFSVAHVLIKYTRLWAQRRVEPQTKRISERIADANRS